MHKRAEHDLTAKRERRIAAEAEATAAQMRLNDEREMVADCQRSLDADLEHEAQLIKAGAPTKAIAAASLKVRSSRNAVDDWRRREDIRRQAVDEAEAKLAAARKDEAEKDRAFAKAEYLHLLIIEYAEADAARTAIVAARKDYDAARIAAATAKNRLTELVTDWRDPDNFPRSERLLTEDFTPEPDPVELVDAITVVGVKNAFAEHNPDIVAVDNVIPPFTRLLIPIEELNRSPHIFRRFDEWDAEQRAKEAEAIKPRPPLVDNWFQEQRAALQKDRKTAFDVIINRLKNPLAKWETD